MKSVLPSSGPARVLVIIALVLLSLALAYVVLVNLALRTAALKKAINRRPDHFVLEWKRASTWFPGSFHLEGVTFVGQGSRSVYYGRIDDARFRISLAALLRKTIASDDFRGRGIEFRLRPATGPGGTNAPSTDHPEIPGLETLPPRTDPRRTGGAPSWKIRVGKVRLEEVAQVWINDFRVEGPGALEGGLDLQIRGPFTADFAPLQFPAATLSQKGVVLATNLQLRAEGRFGPLVFGQDDLKGLRAFDHLGLRLTGEGQLHTVALMERQFGARDFIRFGGGGRLRAEVGLDRGRLVAPSTVSIDSPDLEVHLKDLRFRGAAQVSDVVSNAPAGPVVRLEAQVRDVEAFDGDTRLGRAPGLALSLESVSENLRLDGQFRDAAVRVRIGEVILENLPWLNGWFPGGLGAGFSGGEIRAHGEYEGLPGNGSRGEVRLAGKGLTLESAQGNYETDLALQARFTSAEVASTNELTLENTTVVLTNVFLPGVSRERQEGWFAQVNAARGRISRGEEKGDWRVTADVDVALRDTRPVAAILRAREGAPGWLALVPTIHDVTGSALLNLTPGETGIRRAHLEGKALEVRGELRLGDAPARGIAYARYGPLAVGVDLRQADHKWRVFGAKRWYERAVESPMDPPGAAGAAAEGAAEAAGDPASGRREDP